MAVTWDAIREGDELPQLEKNPGVTQLVKYAAGSGDFNPLHHDYAFPQAKQLGSIIVHGRFKYASLGEPYFFSAESERPFWDAPPAERSVLVFGRESTGLPQEIRARWKDRLVGFPMADPALRSLNLSTCVALAVYEVLRRRRG